MLNQRLLIEAAQPRVPMGATAQQSVANWLTTQYGVKVTNIAGVGSHGADIEGEYEGIPLHFEVKNVESPIVRIVIFSTNIRRPSPLIRAREKNVHRDEHPALRRFISVLTNNQYNSFVDWIDAHRKNDKRIGFPGDWGVSNRSGALPQNRTVKGTSPFMRKYKRLIVRRLSESSTNYLIFLINGKPRMYYVSGLNPLGAKYFPYPSTVMLDTYGKRGEGDFGYGRMRLALKGTFKI